MRELWDKIDIDDTFPDDHVLVASQDLIPWFADLANYLASDIVPSDLSFHQRKKFMYDVKKFFGDEPYLYWSFAGRLIRCCVPDFEMLSVLEACNSHPLVDIKMVSEPQIRYKNVVTIAKFFIKMLISFLKHVIDGNEMAAFQETKISL